MSNSIDLENFDTELQVVNSKPATSGGSLLEKIDRGKHLIFALDASGSMEDVLPSADGSKDYSPYVDVSFGGGTGYGRRGRSRLANVQRHMMKSSRYNVMCEVLEQIVESRWEKNENPSVSLVVFDMDIHVSSVQANRAEIVPAARNSFTRGGTCVMHAFEHIVNNVIPQVPNATYHHIVAITDGNSDDMLEMPETDVWKLFVEGAPRNPDTGRVITPVTLDHVRPHLPNTRLIRWANEVSKMNPRVKLDWIRIGAEAMNYGRTAVDVMTMNEVASSYDTIEFAQMMVPRMACDLLGGLYETVESKDAAQARVLEQATRLCLPPAPGA